MTMVICGNVVDDTINQTVYNRTNIDGHFGNCISLAIMLYQVKDVAISHFTMNGTSGYGTITFSVIGIMTIFKQSKLQDLKMIIAQKYDEYKCITITVAPLIFI